MIDYLRNFHRPTKTSPRAHSDQIKAMVEFTNKLPGLEPAITPDQIKKFVFDQHPERWRIAYTQSGKTLQTNTLMKIVQFMANKKNFADTTNANKKGKGNEDKGCGSG
eukprot:11158027-Ditylum_brightwellii.AAC.1